MNERLPNDTNPEDEKIAQKLSQVAEQTHANSQFAAELEERLRGIRQTKSGWSATILKQFPPALRWVTLMILLAGVLRHSSRHPSPQTTVRLLFPLWQLRHRLLFLTRLLHLQSRLVPMTGAEQNCICLCLCLNHLQMLGYMYCRMNHRSRQTLQMHWQVNMEFRGRCIRYRESCLTQQLFL